MTRQPKQLSLGAPLKGGRSYLFKNMGTFADFFHALYGFHLSKAGKGEKQYHSIESLCAVAKEFFEDELGKIDECEFGHIHLFGAKACEKKDRLTRWIVPIIKEINALVKAETNNELYVADGLYRLLFDEKTGLPQYKHLTSVVKKHTDFYRVRDAKKYELYDRKSMFVLSDRLEHLVGPGRFNPSGYACLYLASNLYLAWEECRRPDFDTFNFSRFQNTRDLEVIDLTIRRKFYYREHFLLAYLALLCTAKAIDEDKHKFQYVVPQMMMKVLCASQRQRGKTAKGAPMIDGIKYMTSRSYDQKDLLFDDRQLTEAYVFPQHPHGDDKNVCPYLTRLFRLTEPRSYFLFKSHRFQFFNRTAYVSRYQDSLFYQMEETLKKDRLAKYNIKDK